jgi:nitrous oxidase accessory protein NosD
MINRKYIISVVLILTLLVSAVSAASLTVGPKAKYHTIQGAVFDARNGDTINVLAGTYKEKVIIPDKSISFIGQTGKYPSVYGFIMSNTDTKIGSANVYGFTITRDGVSGGYLGGNTIRNNKFINCGLVGGGPTFSNNVIMNNLFTNGGVYLDDMSTGNSITGNTFSKSKIGLGLYTGASCLKISGNTFTGCGVGVKIHSIPKTLTGNTYSKNKVNIQTGNF